MKTILDYKLMVATVGAALIATPLIASACPGSKGKTQDMQSSRDYMGDGMQASAAQFSPMVYRTTNSANYSDARTSENSGRYGSATNYKVGHHATNDHAARAKPASAEKDIIDTAINAGNFATLVTAIQAAGLVDTLKGEGPFTVFAPTDDAFAKIPQDKLVALLADKDALTQVLTYHVVPGAVSSSEVTRLDSAKTVQGSSVTIDVTSGVKIDNANVVVADIVTSNGIIHVIDTVIMPN